MHPTWMGGAEDLALLRPHKHMLPDGERAGPSTWPSHRPPCMHINLRARTDRTRSDRVLGVLKDDELLCARPRACVAWLSDTLEVGRLNTFLGLLDMPPAKQPRWERRPNWQQGGSSRGQADAGPKQEAEPAAAVEQPNRITAVERRQLFARLLWLADYPLIFAAEAALNAELLQGLMEEFPRTTRGG